jgi:secretion/DNA translocation related CpaE-like protein
MASVNAVEDRARALIVTADEPLLDDLLRLAAAAGAVPEVAADASAARRPWAGAGVVVVGADLAGAVVDMRLPRRDGVVLAAADPVSHQTWAHAVAIGVSEVLTLPARQSTLIDLFGDCLEGGASGGLTVSVVGGAGGSGATTFAAALAMSSARQGRATLVVDADPLGGGLDLVLGAEREQGLRWPALADTSGRLSAATLRAALPRVGELSMLSWDRGAVVPVSTVAMGSVLSAGQRGHDLVVIDVPRHLDATAREAIVRSSLTLLVVPAEVRAVAAASRVLATVRPHASKMGLVVRGPGPSGLDAQQIGRSLDVAAWVSMRADKGVSSALDEGLGPLRRRRGPLATCCAEVLDRLAGHSTAA